ncbi:ABC transporter, permease protein 1 (cluster 1, maltose/g3p/polyamine/iron) [uncultured Synechococcales cyanobacterium]|uniref:ABC transporter, permease protein 1 (Cluster 1, maltose/g3p/polyamine/iron) n=1 Tax=uncultured Synechococcales cyanobacterium TaxID=1936017 RepID=A0A6J4VY61_9CYAN|nr:ABC transporter, permease protein 1 (cluster 1, maltose/g3p/polyamine/iron) [uncultured Synechococcales cyanobacterium]
MTPSQPLKLKDDSRAALGMAAPALVGLFLFVALPFALAAVLSFTNLRLGSPLPLEFSGLEQYRRIWLDPSFRRALFNNGLFALVVVPVQTAIALGLALLLNRPLRGMAVFRTLFFMPVVFPMALVAVIWTIIYAPGPNGMMNSLLEVLTLGLWEPKDFLRDPAFALPAIMLLSVWQGVGFQMVIILAGLQSAPTVLYEAAAIDGSNQWNQFRYVTLPQLRNTLIFVMLVTSILAFRLFDQVQIMTQGGPLDATTTVMYEAVKAAFTQQKMAKGAAMTVVFFLIVLAITIAQRVLVKEERAID